MNHQREVLSTQRAGSPTSNTFHPLKDFEQTFMVWPSHIWRQRHNKQHNKSHNSLNFWSVWNTRFPWDYFPLCSLWKCTGRKTTFFFTLPKIVSLVHCFLLCWRERESLNATDCMNQDEKCLWEHHEWVKTWLTCTMWLCKEKWLCFVGGPHKFQDL